MTIANAAAENALGTLGTVCWTAQMIPQVWKSWRDKSTEGLSHWLVLLWGISAVFMGVYNVVENLNIPLILQPQLFGVLSMISWGQCLYYGKKKSVKFTVTLVVGCLILMGGIEAGMIFAIRPSYHEGNMRAVQFFGIFSSVLIALALLIQYYEIYKRNEVVGLSILFMTVDMLGGVFSDLSLVFKTKFDVVAGVTYSLVVVMDAIILICAAILNPRANKRRALLEAGDDLENITSSPSTAVATRTASPCTELKLDDPTKIEEPALLSK